MTVLYKLLTEADRRALEAGAAWPGSAVDLRDGFIHMCTAAQKDGVRQRYYASVAPLHIARIDAAQLPDLRWEPATAGELYPHLYRPLPRAAVLDIETAVP